MRPIIYCTVGFAAVAFSFGQALAEQNDPKADGDQQGPLRTIAEPLRDLCRLGFADGQLTLDREHWSTVVGQQDKDKDDDQQDQPGGNVVILPGGNARIRGRILVGIAGRHGAGGGDLDKLIARVRSRMGPTQSSMSAGGKGRTVAFSSQKLSFSASSNDRSFSMTARELEGPQRLLRMDHQADGKALVQLISADGKHVLLLYQGPDGQARLTRVAGQDVQTLQAGSFLELYGQNRELFEQKIWPELQRVGIGLPMMPNSPEIVEATLRILEGMQPETARKGRELLEQLAAGNFKKREAATEALRANYLAYSGLIQAQLAEKDIDNETRHRLETVVKANAQAHRRAEMVHTLKLTDQPHYLVELMGRTESQARRKLLADRLSALTGNSLGPDREAWQKALTPAEDR
jgi:hypothetical protein